MESGLKREATAAASPARTTKKPRDNRLRECFTITPIEGGGESVVCKYCPDFAKTLQKFNPTKARTHLTNQCPGVGEELRQILLETTQAAKRSQNEAAIAINEVAVAASAVQGPPRKRAKVSFRPSPAYISFHAGDANLDVTAPIEGGRQVLRIAFPTELKLTFDAGENMEGAALCVDGFMNTRSDAESSWMGSMWSTSSEGTRAGPHCQWSLSPDGSGAFEGGVTRAQRVEKILKTLIVLSGGPAATVSL